MSHGEETLSINMNEHIRSSASTSHQGYNFHISVTSQTNILAEDFEHVNRYQGMGYDSDGIEIDHHGGDEDISNKEEEGDEEISSEETNDEEEETNEEEDLFIVKIQFDPHKVVIDGIANCIQSKFEMARPLRKKFPESTREMWFEEFKLSEIDIWVQSVGGKKNERVNGLGSLGRSVKATNNLTSTLPKEIDEMIKSQVDALNVDLYAQLQNERKKNKRIRKELHLLMKHVYNKYLQIISAHLKKTTKLMRMKVMMILTM
ncbi:hypothetical protein CQW23_07345 [Capsicum baccatum]|uniref:Uncharacterized protein n=1 Tax=Capsicum baccatum TaxID=33114 RepID=A0A2G2X600_CAPBA|nr:hypothetical protein CQW23_07345 [Capsicum baccatum]